MNTRGGESKDEGARDEGVKDEEVYGLVAEAIVAELREVLNTADLNAEVSVRDAGDRDPVVTFAGSGHSPADVLCGRVREATVVIGLPLGEGAVLARRSSGGSPMASRMTLRVGKVGADGVVTFGRERVIKVRPDPGVLRADACRYPPCACTPCRAAPRREVAALPRLPLRPVRRPWARR